MKARSQIYLLQHQNINNYITSVRVVVFTQRLRFIKNEKSVAENAKRKRHNAQDSRYPF